jgi:hypothetical protein
VGPPCGREKFRVERLPEAERTCGQVTVLGVGPPCGREKFRVERLPEAERT